MSVAAEPRDQEGTALVVFGRDATLKPRASAFDQADAEPAERAAKIMGLHVIRPDSDEQHALAAKLPRGRVFASGKAFVPFVKAGLYEALEAQAGASVAEKPTPKAASASTAPPSPPEGTSKARDNIAPETWDDISVGSIVLATEGPQEGWFESIVLRAEDDLFTLKWRDWPRLPTFTRRTWQIGLLPPGHRA
jgi:hypothetical protein